MPKFPWRHSDERKTWRTAKQRHSKALTTAKVKFKQDLGKSLDKLAKATAKTPPSREAAVKQARAVLTLTRDIKKIIADYRLRIASLPNAAQKDLNKALDRIYKEVHKWEGGINETEVNVKLRVTATEGSSAPPMPSRRPQPKSEPQFAPLSGPSRPSPRTGGQTGSGSDDNGKGKAKAKSPKPTMPPPLSQRRTTQRRQIVPDTDSDAPSSTEREPLAPLTPRGRVRVDEEIELSEVDSEQDTPEVQEQPITPPPLTRRRAPRGETLTEDTSGQVKVTEDTSGQTNNEPKEEEAPRTRQRRGTFGTIEQTAPPTQSAPPQPEQVQPVTRPRRGTFGTLPEEEAGVEQETELQEDTPTPFKTTPQDENTVPGT